MGIVLRKEWRKTRALEKAAERPGRERQLERLLGRVEAQELTLEESMQRLEERAGELDRASDEHGRRLENLEAVVVSQAWEALHSPKAAKAEEHPVAIVPTRPHETDEPTVEQRNRQRAADLARRVGG